MESEDLFQYDKNWPPINNKKAFHEFTKMEDSLILDYLIAAKRFDHLGGNEVWKTMSRSRKFNPSGRSYQGLRERFLKYIVRHLNRFTRATSPIRARFLKQNPKALKDINAMKSTSELKRDLGARLSSEDEEEAVGENTPDNTTIASALVERKRLIDGLMANKTSTAEPQDSSTQDQIPSEEVEPEESVVKDSNVGASEQDSSNLFSNHSAEEPNEEEAVQLAEELAGQPTEELAGQPTENLAGQPIEELAEEPNEEEAAVKSNFEMSIQLSHICPALLFVFERVKSDDEHQDVRYTMQLLQNSLRDTLETHSNALSVQSYSCPHSACKGTSTYFGLWEELMAYLAKIDQYQLRFDECYVRFFLRVTEEILSTPLCCAKPSPKLPKIEARDLCEYLRCESALQLRKNLESLEKLMKFVRNVCS